MRQKSSLDNVMPSKPSKMPKAKQKAMPEDMEEPVYKKPSRAKLKPKAKGKK